MSNNNYFFFVLGKTSNAQRMLGTVMFPLFSLHLGVRFPPDFLRTAASEGTTCDGFRVSCGVRGVALNTEFQQTSLENEQEMDLTGSGSGPVSGAVSQDWGETVRIWWCFHSRWPQDTNSWESVCTSSSCATCSSSQSQLDSLGANVYFRCLSLQVYSKNNE